MSIGKNLVQEWKWVGVETFLKTPSLYGRCILSSEFSFIVSTYLDRTCETIKKTKKYVRGKKMSPTSKAEIKNIDHLGIVAGLIDEIGIVETINSKLGIDSREKISAGIIVKSVLINGLGFVARPMYLFSQFFEDKAIEILLGEGVKRDYINDDKIGRVMEKLYQHGLNNLFVEIVLFVIKKFKIETKYFHLDATSFHLHGKY